MEEFLESVAEIFVQIIVDLLGECFSALCRYTVRG